MLDFAYFYGDDAEHFNFFRLPKKLIRDSKFNNLSTDAKILYGILLDRLTISMKNGWVDEENRLYIIYSVKEIMQEFRCSERKAIMLMAELDTKNGIGLVQKKRQGLGRPNILYIKNFNAVAEEEKKSEEHQKEISQKNKRITKKNCEINNRRITDFQDMQNLAVQDMQNPAVQDMQNPAVQDMQNLAVQDMQNLAVQDMQNLAEQNDTEKNDKYNIYNLSIHQETGEERWNDYKAIRTMFHKKLNIDLLQKDYPKEAAKLEEIVELIADICCQESEKKQRIGNLQVTTEQFRSRMLMLSMEHIRYVLFCQNENKAYIRNIRAYLITCLYNAPTTMHHFYDLKVKNDYGF